MSTSKAWLVLMTVSKHGSVIWSYTCSEAIVLDSYLLSVAMIRKVYVLT